MYTIGKLAGAAGVTPETLRYYERERLLKPDAKSSSGYRLYETAALRRVYFIRHAQRCGFSLAKIRELLTVRARDAACCSDVRSLAIQRKLELEARIASMKAMSVALDKLIDACSDGNDSVDHCPILMGLDSAVQTH